MKNLSGKILTSVLAGTLGLFSLAACSSEAPDQAGDAAGSQGVAGQTAPGGSADAGNSGAGAASAPSAAATSVGTFTTQDVNGNTVTQDIFAEHELTLVNVFATWCSPCVEEIPDLEKLHQQVESENVGVVGIVLDALDEQGNIADEGLQRAQLLVEKSGVTYPILVPDSTSLNGRLTGIDAIPETFFVDKNGNIVGESYTGSRSLEDWTQVVETELTNLRAGV